MASYALFVGARDDGPPDASFELGDGDVLALGISPDPYLARQRWSGAALKTLRAQLDDKIAGWLREAVAGVLAETHRPAIEPWMNALLASRVAGDARVGHARTLLALVTRAQAAKGSVSFFGD